MQLRRLGGRLGEAEYLVPGTRYEQVQALGVPCRARQFAKKSSLFMHLQQRVPSLPLTQLEQVFFRKFRS